MGRLSKSFSVFLVILCLLLLVVLPSYTVKIVSRTLVVPDKYPTIQAAIGNARAGDTVFVKKGEYYLPPISINESLSLVGESAQYTIINGGNPDSGTNLVTLQIGAPDVTISGFTIDNCLTAILVENWAWQSVPSRSN